jgi:membrane fusion protein (multidrug efflux system)
MFGRISVVYDVHENALQVPRSALVEETDSLSVFVVEDGLAIRKFVTTGYGNRGMIEITTGLEEGEQVVTVGQVSLKQDSKVTVINQTDTGELAADTNDPDAEQQISENASTD